jgi:hypothetical protein
MARARMISSWLQKGRQRRQRRLKAAALKTSTVQDGKKFENRKSQPSSVAHASCNPSCSGGRGSRIVSSRPWFKCRVLASMCEALGSISITKKPKTKANKGKGSKRQENTKENQMEILELN